MVFMIFTKLIFNLLTT